MNSHIFRSYDIRGIYGKDIDNNTTKDIGNVLGNHVDNDIVIGIDMRKSSEIMKEFLIEGILNSGKNIIDIGLLPIGAALFYAWQNKKTLAYLTASHLPSEWAGIKFFHEDGTGFMDNENYEIRDKFLNKEFKETEKGKLETVDSKKVMNEYSDYLLSKIKIENEMNITIDCGNGMSSIFAPELFRKAGCNVNIVYGDLKEESERNPEPNEDPLDELRKTEFDIGIAYDGDADRMILVSDKEILSPEKSASLILSVIENNDPIIANVECSRSIDKIASGREVIRVPVGHTFLAKYAKQKNACFGVESSGHYILPSLVPFDDAIAVSLFAVSALSKSKNKLSNVVKNVIKYPFERINVDVDEKIKFKIIGNIKKRFLNEYEKVNTMDGVRIDFDNGWVLVRASNTSPMIRITIEADDENELQKLKKKFTKELNDEIFKASS